MTSYPPPSREDGRWLYLPGNIPSLYEFCRTAIRNDLRLRDAVLLTPDLLPNSVADDVLDDDDGYRQVVDPPNPSLVPSSDCVEGPCPSGFFPRSAAFLDETTAVVLGNDGGTCCAQRAVVTIERGGAGDVRWIVPPSRVPGTMPSRKDGGGGGVWSENVSLRADGSAVWIARDALHVAPLSDDDPVSRTELRFTTKGPPAPLHDDVVVVLPDMLPSRQAFFAIGRRKSKAGEGHWDLLEIHAETGEIRSVSAAEGAGAERLGFRPSNLVERSDGKLIAIESERELEHLEIYGGSVQRDGTGAPTAVQWSLETRVEGFPKDGTRPAFGDVRLVCSSEYDGICAVIGGSRDRRRERPPWLCVSGCAEEDWELAEESQTLTNGIGGYPPALAFAPSGELFAFAYEAEACQRAERKHILRLKMEWPSLSVYKWSKRLYDRQNCQR